MPLPAALAAKLAKRGILTKKTQLDAQEPPDEEVIAENYDTPAQKKKRLFPSLVSKLTEDDLLLAHRGHEGCPNKYNIYHECTTFCVTLWKIGVLRPDPKYLRRKAKLLKQYPLPDGWKEVFDRGCGRFYFWNLETDEVSWYPPNHPKAKISRSAACIREAKSLAQETLQHSIHSAPAKRPETNDESSDSSDSEDEAKSEVKKPQSLRGNRQRRDIIDPMDPAAYSDIPRGTWSSGLEGHAEAKTGVDTTATGPLYQMRPYPSPGSVLAANAKGRKS